MVFKLTSKYLFNFLYTSIVSYIRRFDTVGLYTDTCIYTHNYQVRYSDVIQHEGA